MQFDRQDYRQDHGAFTGSQMTQTAAQRAAPVHCFAPDAPITTLMGERDIDSLMPGQMVLTNSGPRSPRLTRLTPQGDGLLCHVPAGAFGPNVPIRDLWLSPDQPIALRLDQSTPGRIPVTHRLGNLIELFASDKGATPQVRPMPDTVIQLQFDRPAVIYLAGLPVYIGDTHAT